MKKSNALLALIFVALVAIFGFMVYDHEQTPTVSEQIGEFTEEVSDATSN